MPNNIFNKIADDYDEVALVERHMGEQLLERLAQTEVVPTRILDVGCGTGFFTEQLQQRYPDAEVIGIDSAENMVALAAQRCSPNKLVLADIFEYEFTTSFDVIFVNMLLPWITDTQALLLRLQQLLAPNGLLLFSSLGPDTLKELRATWQALDNHAHVNTFIDMHDLGDQLRALNFESVVLDRENIEVTFSDVPTLLHTMKICGSVKQQPTQFVGQALWQQLIKQYPHTNDGDITASGELIYAHVRAPKAAQEVGVSYVSLSQLKRKKD